MGYSIEVWENNDSVTRADYPFLVVSYIIEEDEAKPICLCRSREVADFISNELEGISDKEFGMLLDLK